MVVKVVAFDDRVNVSVPVSGSASDFDNECATGNVVLPDSARPQLSEGSGKVFQHIDEALLVPDRESEVFDAHTLLEIDVLDKPIDASTDAGSTWSSTDTAEPITAVNRNGNRVTAVSADEGYVIVPCSHNPTPFPPPKKLEMPGAGNDVHFCYIHIDHGIFGPEPRA